MPRTADTYTSRVENSKNYLKYENGLNLEEFKQNRIITVRSLYFFGQEVLDMDMDCIENEIIERMEDSDRCEADELIYTITKPQSTLAFSSTNWTNGFLRKEIP